MKKILCGVLTGLFVFFFTSCGSGCCSNPIELMGAGDRIHDSYTFANTGVEIETDDKITYTIYGSVEPLEDEDVKKEFDIDEDVTHIVAVKLTATEDEVDSSAVSISVDGERSYDAEHLNGSDYTFIILEVKAGGTVTIKVKWNESAEERTYIIYFSEDIELK